MNSLGVTLQQSIEQGREARLSTHNLRSAQLFTGDDAGQISVWDLIPVLDSLGQQYGTEPIQHPEQCINSKRIVSYDAAEEMQRPQRMRGLRRLRLEER